MRKGADVWSSEQGIGTVATIVGSCLGNGDVGVDGAVVRGTIRLCLYGRGWRRWGGGARGLWEVGGRGLWGGGARGRWQVVLYLLASGFAVGLGKAACDHLNAALKALVHPDDGMKMIGHDLLGEDLHLGISNCKCREKLGDCTS